MKILSKKLAAAAIAGVMLLPASAMAQTELTLVSWFWGAATYGDWLEEVVVKFEAEHPGVTINKTKVAGNNRFTTNYSLMVAGTPSDITHLAAREYQPFADEGFLEDLDPWIEKSGLDLTGWAGQGTCQWKGKTNCLMLLYAGYVMGYNEKLLNDAGVAVPTDYESYLEAVMKTTKDVDGDGITDVYGAALNLTLRDIREQLLGLALDAGGSLVTPDGQPAFDSPAVIEALRRYKFIVGNGYAPKGASTEDMRTFLNEGRLAIMIDGPWIEGIMQRAAPEVGQHLRLARDPLDPPVGGTSNIFAMPVDISDEKKELVWEFILTAASEEMQLRWAQISASPAPMPGLDYTEIRAANPNFAITEDAMNRAAAAGVDRILKGFEIESNELNKIIFTEIQKMMINDVSPEETGAAIQAGALALK